MAQKNVTNHQLGIALAELIQEHKATVERTVEDIKLTERKIDIHINKLGDTQRHVAQQLKNSTIRIDLEPVESINKTIGASTEAAKVEIKKLLKSFWMTKYIILTPAICILMLLFATAVFFKVYNDLKNENTEMKSYYDNTSKYFEANPSEWQKVKDWFESNE